MSTQPKCPCPIHRRFCWSIISRHCVCPPSCAEYDKVARRCAPEKTDFPRCRLRLTELELLDRDRRATERRIRQARFPVVKSLDSFDLPRYPLAQQDAYCWNWLV